MSNSPNPFCFNRSNVKAFVLGCDPTNESNKRERVEIEFAFGIGKDARYFRQIMDNLNLVGLHLEDLYIQNLIIDYQGDETSNNKTWRNDAIHNVKVRIKEFSRIDPNRELPVFLTSKILYEVLLNDDEKRYTPKELYTLKTTVPIPADQNKLNRPLIPLYRHQRYNLLNWPEYLSKLKKYFKNQTNDK